MVDNDRADPIFIHGIMPRSGTNFLWELLLLHPGCVRPREPVREDLFLDHSDHLASFVEEVHQAWDPRWGTFGPEIRERFYAALGDGLVSFLWPDRSRRLVTKSPSVRHLDRFFSFYARAKLIVLVRDGRSVVQSAIDTFGWDFDRGCREWSQAADTVRRFQEAEQRRADRWRLVRYEDLLDDTVGQVSALLGFLELDATRYDFEAACAQPVRGSSAFGRDGRTVHWRPVPRDASFSPKERWRSWSEERMERFDWLAGDQLRALGYDSVPCVRSMTATVGHRWRDCRWTTARMARWALYRTRVRAGIASRPLRRRLGLVRET